MQRIFYLVCVSVSRYKIVKIVVGVNEAIHWNSWSVELLTISFHRSSKFRYDFLSVQVTNLTIFCVWWKSRFTRDSLSEQQNIFINFLASYDWYVIQHENIEWNIFVLSMEGTLHICCLVVKTIANHGTNRQVSITNCEIINRKHERNTNTEIIKWRIIHRREYIKYIGGVSLMTNTQGFL